MLTENEKGLCDQIEKEIEQLNREIAKIIEDSEEKIKKRSALIAMRCKEREDIIREAMKR